MTFKFVDSLPAVVPSHVLPPRWGCGLPDMKSTVLGTKIESYSTLMGTVISVVVSVPRHYEIGGDAVDIVMKKFMKKFVSSSDGCMLWTGHLDKDGYPRFSVKVDGKPKTVGAHRWIFEQKVRPLTIGEVPDHKCRIRHCVNWEHLEAVSHGENARRGRVRLSLVNKTHCKNEHLLSLVGTKIDSSGTVICIQCERDKTARCHARYFDRRVAYCAEAGLVEVICERGHRLDVSNALLASGWCRECHRENAQFKRDKVKRGNSG